MTLTLKIANQSFCTTLRLMMRHHNTKFGNKMFCNLEDFSWTNIDIFTPSCDLDLECSSLMVPMFRRFRRYHLDKHSQTF